MPYYKNDPGWMEQAPEIRFRGPYEDYGWESGQSVLPEFRDPSVHRMAYERLGERFRSPYSQREGRYNRDVEPHYGYESSHFGRWSDYDEPGRRGPYRYDWEGGAYGESYGRRPGWEGPYEWARRSGRYEDWLTPGPYTGLGPRGYRRSDERITEDVCHRLTQHGQIDASDIEIEVNSGEVTLKGTVDSRWTKRRAEDIAASVSGVMDVHNQLRLSEPYREREMSQSAERPGNQKRESGVPGGGQGRIDEVGKSGVYPASGPLPSSDAEVQGMASWGQGERGAAGYEDHGESEIWFTEEELAESTPGVTRTSNQPVVSQSSTVQEISDAKTRQWQVRVGMDVVGSDGKSVGRVKEVRNTDFLVDRPLARDVYVPFEACQSISAERIVLTIPAGEVNNQGWANPGLMEAEPSVSTD
jgi:hypothetical protein